MVDTEQCMECGVMKGKGWACPNCGEVEPREE